MKKWICLAVLCLMGVVLQSTRTRGFECQGGDEDHEINELYQSPAREDICLFQLESVKEGDVVKVGIYFSIEEGWNIYDNNPEGHGYLPTRGGVERAGGM